MLIYLIGMPACGKSSVAKKLAKKLNYKFYDLDSMIEKEVAMSISEYFERHGEENFRIIEQEILRKTFTFNDSVIATGGGTPCFFNNINEINQNGLSIYLEASVNLIMNRLSQRGGQDKRPLVADKKNNEELHEYLTTLYMKRMLLYQKAHKTFSALNINIDAMVKTINKDHTNIFQNVSGYIKKLTS